MYILTQGKTTGLTDVGINQNTRKLFVTHIQPLLFPTLWRLQTQIKITSATI